MSANFTYAYKKWNCPKCGRGLLIEMAVNGIRHDMELSATCAGCISLSDDSDFAKNEPKAYADVKAWIAGGPNKESSKCNGKCKIISPLRPDLRPAWQKRMSSGRNYYAEDCPEHGKLVAPAGEQVYVTCNEVPIVGCGITEGAAVEDFANGFALYIEQLQERQELSAAIRAGLLPFTVQIVATTTPSTASVVPCDCIDGVSQCYYPECTTAQPQEPAAAGQWKLIDEVTISAPAFSGYGDYDLLTVTGREQVNAILNSQHDELKQANETEAELHRLYDSALDQVQQAQRIAKAALLKADRQELAATTALRAIHTNIATVLTHHQSEDPECEGELEEASDIARALLDKIEELG